LTKPQVTAHPDAHKEDHVNFAKLLDIIAWWHGRPRHSTQIAHPRAAPCCRRSWPALPGNCSTTTPPCQPLRAARTPDAVKWSFHDRRLRPETTRPSRAHRWPSAAVCVPSCSNNGNERHIVQQLTSPGVPAALARVDIHARRATGGRSASDEPSIEASRTNSSNGAASFPSTLPGASTTTASGTSARFEGLLRSESRCPITRTTDPARRPDTSEHGRPGSVGIPKSRM